MYVIIALLSALGVVALACCAIYGGYGQGLLVSISSLAALVFAIFYGAKGYSKDAAKYLHNFLLANCCSVFFCTLFLGRYLQTNTMVLSMCLIIFGILCGLTTAKDLGEKNSKILSYLLLFESIFAFVASFFIYNGVHRGGPLMNSVHLVNMAVQCLFALMTVLAIHAKYQDKKKRGSK